MDSTMKRLLPKGGFSRGVAVLVTGTASGQAIVILASPILTRLYTPGEFADLALYASVLAVMAVCVALRYELAIPLPQNERHAVQLLFLALTVTALVTVLAALLILFLGDRITGLLNARQLDSYLWLLPFGIVLTGIYQAFSFWAIRKKTYGIMSKTKVQQGLGAVLTQVIAGFLHLGTAGLIVGHIVGQVVGFASLARLFASHRNKMPPDDTSGKKLFRGFRDRLVEYRDFPLYSLPTALLNTVGAHAPIFIMTIFFKPAAVGMYFLAYRTLMSPVGILTDSIAKVFTGRAVQEFNDGELGNLVDKVQSGLIKLSAGPLLMIIPVAPVMFKRIFGEQWAEAGGISQVLALWLLWLILSNPISPAFAVVDKHKLAFGLEVLQSGLRVASLVAGGLLASFYLALLMFVAASIFTITLKIYFAHAVTGASFRAWTKNVLRELAIVSCAIALSLVAFDMMGEFYGALIWLIIFLACLYRSAKSFRSMRSA